MQQASNKNKTRAGGLILSTKGSAMVASQRLNVLSRGSENANRTDHFR